MCVLVGRLVGCRISVVVHSDSVVGCKIVLLRGCNLVGGFVGCSILVEDVHCVVGCEILVWCGSVVLVCRGCCTRMVHGFVECRVFVGSVMVVVRKGCTTCCRMAGFALVGCPTG